VTHHCCLNIASLFGVFNIWHIKLLPLFGFVVVVRLGKCSLKCASFQQFSSVLRLI
jgi:hypothetical protein